MDFEPSMHHCSRDDILRLGRSSNTEVEVDQALRLLNGRDPSNGTELVDQVWLRRAGIAAARRHAYVCEIEGCGIPMYPIFPTKPREGGRIPKCHFGSRGRAHIGHGVANHVADPPSTSDRVYPHSDLPTVWRDRASKVDGDGAGTSAGPEGRDRTLPARSARGSTSGRAGEKSVSSIGKLVELWRAGYPDIEDRPFRMPGSGATCWSELFRIVDSTAAIKADDRRVWLGEVKKTQIWGSTSVDLFLEGQTPGRQVQIKVYLDSAWRNRHPQSFELLEKEWKRRQILVYLLGTRNPHTRSIAVISPDHVVIVDPLRDL